MSIKKMNIKKVFVAGKVHPLGLKVLEERDDIDFRMIDHPTESDFINLLPDYDALLIRTMRLPKQALLNSKQLKVISRHGVGYDNVPVDLATKMNIPVAIIENVNAIAVAEHTLSMILALAKQTCQYDREVRQGNWAIQNSLAASELWNKKILLVGFGRIGFEVLKRLKGFDAEVLVYDPYLSDEKVKEYGVTRVKLLKEAVQIADIISLHIPLTPETDNLFDEQMISLMKQSAFLINTARGGLIDEFALAQALKYSRIKGAALDTVIDEPMPASSPLAQQENVLLSPHSAGLTDECAARMGISSVKNVIAGLDGYLNQNLVVNREVLITE
ncbi:hydroxyacid dehydrogenase [Colwellia demingiae]|uniref:Hydroxyacid dehydrogenase n=1 Tax=Colwellia demingiae TaxID=89401 RepID=A0A5C6Q6J9_9GAMM|nr:hydroxyacid dehydrogenase [Colwellia demingiae]TWX64351.1 hydroxyacid dehydrogenase [Colwellia demingiae]